MQYVRYLNFDDPTDNIYATTKMLGHHGGEISYAYLSGTIFVWDPIEKLIPILGIVGLSVNRLHPLENGTMHQLGKELCYYTELHSGNIIESWFNTYNQRECEILPVRNHLMNVHWTDSAPSVRLGDHHTTEDEMNAEVMHKKQDGAPSPMVLPWAFHGDIATVTLDAMMKYPNPINRDEFPEAWSGETINANEHMTFFTSLSDLQNHHCLSASYTMVLTRIGRFLPWMLMGTDSRRLFYRSHAWKLMDGIDGFPRFFLDHVEKHDSDFLTPPTEWTDERAVTSQEMYARIMRQKSHANTSNSGDNIL